MFRIGSSKTCYVLPLNCMVDIKFDGLQKCLLSCQQRGLSPRGVPSCSTLCLAQGVCCSLCEMRMAWSRWRVWQAGRGALPVVFSVTLFMWFRESVFYRQLALMLGTLLAKEYITWNYGGRVRHF